MSASYKIDGGQKIAMTPEEIALAFPPAPPPLPQPPASPKLSAAAFNLAVTDYDITGLDGGFNIGGAIYFGPGEYLVFFLSPIEGRYAPLFMSAGGSVMTATATDAYSMTIEARTGGELADPEGFSMQVFTL